MMIDINYEIEYWAFSCLIKYLLQAQSTMSSGLRAYRVLAVTDIITKKLHIEMMMMVILSSWKLGEREECSFLTFSPHYLSLSSTDAPLYYV